MTMLDSGLSVSVLSLCSGGMHYSCEKLAALDALERMLLLAEGDAVSSHDVELISHWARKLARLPRCVNDGMHARIAHRMYTRRAAHT